MINKEVVVFQIEDMLSNTNKENLLTYGGHIENGTAFLELMTNVLTVLKEQPELVHCWECKHRSKEMYDYYGNPNDKRYVCQIHDLAKKPDWFCGDGERQ